MKRKAEIKKAYDDSVYAMQKMDVINGGIEIEKCAAWQEALLWVLGRQDIRPYRKKENYFDKI
jgi:hypothetical protein